MIELNRQENAEYTRNTATSTPVQPDQTETNQYQSSGQMEEVTPRQTWGSYIEFMLAEVAFSVDITNFMSFPILCYYNGGVVFLLPFLVMTVLMGFPLLYMELSMGQYFRCGCISVWTRAFPAGKGLGYGLCLITFLVAIYYTTLVAWFLYYLFASMASEVPWETCSNYWNTANCIKGMEVQSTNYNYDYSYMMNVTEPIIRVTPGVEFFERKLLGLQSGYDFENLGPVKYDVCFCLFSVFVGIYFALWKGVRISGKVVCITATVSYGLFILLLLRGLTLDGAMEGLKYYIYPNIVHLYNANAWISAAGCVFFSISPCFGVHLTLASYKDKRSNNNCIDAIVICAVIVGSSILFGLVTFSFMGHLAFVRSIPMDSAVNSGLSGFFVGFPEALSLIPLSTMWSVFYFLMMLLLSFDTAFMALETIVTAIIDEWPSLRRRRELVVLLLVFACCICAIPTTTRGGVFLVVFLDTYACTLSMCVIAVLETAAVILYYGTARIRTEQGLMRIVKLGWISVALFMLLVLCRTSLYRNILYYDDYEYPSWSLVVGNAIILSSILCVPIGAVLVFIATPGPFSQRLRCMMEPVQTN